MTGASMMVVCPWLMEDKLCLKEKQKKKEKKDAKLQLNMTGFSSDPAYLGLLSGNCLFLLVS